MKDYKRGRVLVTGASTGIGEATARHLHQLGFTVLATARRAEDAEQMRERGMTPVLLNVTDAEQIAAARAEFGKRPLVGLVNNAGLNITGPLEFVSIDDLRYQFEVNVIGQMAVTQAFMDALLAGRGRIVNVGSILGRMATPIVGPYAASKFALAALTDTLRRELRPQGVGVILIEPGGVRTPLMKKSTERLRKLGIDGPPELTQRYGAMICTAAESMDRIDRRNGVHADMVANVIGSALTARRSRTRYLIGRDAYLQAALARILTDRFMDRLLLSRVKS